MEEFIMEGFEDYEKKGPSLPYVKKLNGSAALEAKLPPGTLINTSTNVVLAEPEKEFIFVPVKYYVEYAIWDANGNLIKKTNNIKGGVWSDGSSILTEEISFVNNKPPIANKSHNFVVVPVSELASDDPKYVILSLGTSNKFSKEFVDELNIMIERMGKEHKCKQLYSMGIAIATGLVKNDKGNAWYEYTSSRFVKIVEDKTVAKLKPVYETVKDINTTQLAIQSTIVNEIPAQIEEAVVVEVTADSDF